MGNNLILQIKDLEIEFHTHDGVIHAVNNVHLNVNKKETLGIVGESGCGKSVATQSILQLTPIPPGKIVNGKILYKGQDLIKASEEEINKIRGREIAMIFQEPMTSLNPVFTVENQIAETIKLHFPPMSKEKVRKLVIESLSQVGIPDPETRLGCYPHELSGGMRQRIMIAMALVCKPSILIADEPTTALDVTIQAQILYLINELQQKSDMSVILITHDLGVIAETADRVAVMYAGKVVEHGTVENIFNNPTHPYTQGLLSSIPSYSQKSGFDINARLDTIRGMVPSLKEKPTGCSFHNRCPKGSTICLDTVPTLKKIDDGIHQVACFHSEKK